MTFESETQQPETIRGEVAGSLTGAVAKAARRAWKQKPTKNRYSSVVVLLEKRRRDAAEATDESRDAA